MRTLSTFFVVLALAGCARPLAVADRCGCAVTGRCTCGDSCKCQVCPAAPGLDLRAIAALALAGDARPPAPVPVPPKPEPKPIAVEALVGHYVWSCGRGG